MNTERTIMVANTKTQKKYKLTTNASTLGELKQCLAANNIDYSDMAFTEGITKTTLNDDNAALPTNIPYKGTTTNNLVLLLTNTRKNIASGLIDRKAAYTLIKRNNLQETVKNIHGRNFTQVPTESLEKIINTYVGNTTPAPTQQAQTKKLTAVAVEIKPVNIKDVIVSLCKYLLAKDVLTADEIGEMAEELADCENSDFDIDSMMAGI